MKIHAGAYAASAGLDEAAETALYADLAAMDAALDTMRSLLTQPAAYARAVGEFTRALARASKNPLFEMLTAWHHAVTAELEPLFLVTRPATEAHLEGMALVARLVRSGDATRTRELVTTFHDWSVPRLLAAAALQAGAPLDRLTEDLR